MPNPSENDSVTRARQGITLHRMRYVLSISLVLGVCALLLTWAFV